MHADLNPDGRLHASGGQARSLYAELTKNISTRTKPEGGPWLVLLKKFVAQAAKADAKAGGTTTEDIIRQRLGQLAEMVNGYDFADVIATYCRGFQEGMNNSRPMPFAGCGASFPQKRMRGRH